MSRDTAARTLKPAVRPLLPAMSGLLYVAAVLVFLAGCQLFIFSDHTARYFAWTIHNPLAAAFLGAGYWASAPFEALAARQRIWANARIVVPTVLVFTLLTLITTLTHLGTFHFGSQFAIGTRLVTFAWIAIYIVVPLLLLIFLAMQLRTPGIDPPRSVPLPVWVYGLLAVQATVLLGLGVALLATSGAGWWPWKLTPLLAPATGAWLIAFGLAAAQVLVERDARRVLPVSVGSLVLAVLQFIALARYTGRFEWSSAVGGVYLALLATMLITGSVGLASAKTRLSSRTVKMTVRRGAERSARSVVPLVAAGCGLVLAVTGCSGSSNRAASAAAPQSSGSAYTLMQMNLCLSGLAGCFTKVKYPAVVMEAVTRIREAHPDAVTFSEACSGDVALIARRTGYYMRFSEVPYYGKPLPCIRPGGRGIYGNAVLSRTSILSAVSQPFEAQAGPERRVWLCASIRIGVDVCTAQLATHQPAEVAANELQCTELGAILARRAKVRAVIFGGDVNRHPSCAPHGFWTRTDRAAHQDPGSQQVYGTGAFRSPSTQVIAAVHTDHDVLLVRAYLSAQ